MGFELNKNGLEPKVEYSRGHEGPWFLGLYLSRGAGGFSCPTILMSWGIFMSYFEEDPTHKSAWGEFGSGNSDILQSNDYTARRGE